MKNIKYILLILFLSFILFCTRPPRESIQGTYDPKTRIWLPQTYSFEKTKVFNSSFDEIWFTIIDFLSNSEMRIQSIDKASGVIILQEWTEMDIPICDCGHYTIKVKSYRGWKRRPVGEIVGPVTIYSTIYSKSIDTTHTEVKMVNDFRIIYRDRRGKGILDKSYKPWTEELIQSLLQPADEVECTSTGVLESWFYQMIEMRLLSPRGNSGAK